MSALHMTPDKSNVLYGTLGSMVIKTLEALRAK
jgi:hypothetical protein